MMRSLTLLSLITGLFAVDLQVTTLKRVEQNSKNIVLERYGSYFGPDDDSGITMKDVISVTSEKQRDFHVIVLTLNDAGAKKINAFTGKHIKEDFAIFVDKKCVSEARVQTPTTVNRIVFLFPGKAEDLEGFVRNLQSGTVGADPKQ